MGAEGSTSCSLGFLLEPSGWAVFETSRTRLGGALGRLGVILKVSWPVLGVGKTQKANMLKMYVSRRAWDGFGCWGPLLEQSWAPLGTVLGPLLGPSWAPLGTVLVRGPPLGPLLEQSWGTVGQSWRPVGPSRSAFGLSWGPLGSLLGRLRAVFGASGTVVNAVKVEE